MSPRSSARHRRRTPQVRLGLLFLALTLILAPAVDRAAEAGPLNVNGVPAKVLDLCAVPGLVLVPLEPRPVEFATPFTSILTLHFPSPLVRISDHPPRPA